MAEDSIRGRISRYGTRFAEKMKKADEVEKARQARAADPLLSAMDKFEHSEGVCGSLSKALTKQLNKVALDKKRATDLSPGGWYEANGLRGITTAYAAKVAYDMPRDEYTIRLYAAPAGQHMGAPHYRAYVVTEATLYQHTQSVDLFNSWITAIALRMMSLLTASSHHQQTMELHEDAIQELKSFGVRTYSDFDGIPPFPWDGVTPQEERAAIESILREIE